jgi:hypothetical protein
LGQLGKILENINGSEARFDDFKWEICAAFAEMSEKIDVKLAQINNNHENKPFEPDRGWQFEASSENN